MNQNTNIPNEDNNLDDLAPKLSKLKANGPFNASDSYFDSFNSKLQNRIEDEEDIKAFAPTLLSIDKYNPFDIPADYFEEFPTLIQEKVISGKSTTTAIEWLSLIFKPRFVLPFATMIIVTIAGINYMNQTAEVVNEGSPEEISLEDHLYTVDETEIIEQYAAGADMETETTPADDQSIENYLLENNIDESDL